MTDEEKAYNYASKQKASKFQIGEIAKFYNDEYHQAEEDNELSWEDISKIISIDQQVCGIMGISDYTHNHQQAMKEILKRFNKERKEK
jgi:uncharacterized protein YeaO (DUF488 family)